jgi:hypothetical protein
VDIKAIKELAAKYSVDELMMFADELENTGKSSCQEVAHKNDSNDLMSDFLQSAEVKGLLNEGMNLNEAVREFSKRVRGVLS